MQRFALPNPGPCFVDVDDSAADARASRSLNATPLIVNLDRRLAIEQAIRTAQPGDLVVIAGKGHEKYQTIGNRTLPFDDVDVAQTALGSRRRGTRV